MPQRQSCQPLIQAGTRLDAAYLTERDVLEPRDYILLGFTLDGRTGLADDEDYEAKLRKPTTVILPCTNQIMEVTMSTRTTLIASLGAFLVALSFATAAEAQQIFADGFESGDTSAWSKARKPKGLDVNGDAAHTGDFGLEILSGRGRTGVQDNSPKSEDAYMVDFFFNPDNWEMLLNKKVDILQLIGKGGKGAHVRLQLKQIGENRFELRLLARENTGRFRFVGSAEVRRNEWTSVSVLWARAGTEGLDQGLAALFTDGSLRGERDNLDNDRFTIDTARLGLLKKAGAAKNGGFYLDDFESFRTLSP